MHIGVLGAGAVGGVLAALLDRAGHEVTVTARGGHLAAIRADGLHLTGHWGSHIAPVAADTVLPTGLDLAIVTTKAQDSAAALLANRSALDGIPVLIVQNGLEGMSTASTLLPHSPIAGGLALFAASYLAPGEVGVTTAAHTYLGGDAADRVAAILAPVMPVEVVANFAGAQWTKLFINQVNALPAITGLTVQEVIAEHRLRRILTASMRETVITGLAARVRFASLQTLSHDRLVLFAALPLLLGQWIPLRMAARMGNVPNPGSTLQSIRRGQPTEIDYLNGAVVAQAAVIGRTAPINSDITALVHEVEASGAFIPIAEVVRRVRR